MHTLLRSLMALAFIGTLHTAAHASEADLHEAYAAYQEAATMGDLHAALPHARDAYEAGLELYGPESRETALRALDLARVLCGVVLWEEAIEVLPGAMTAFHNDTSPNLRNLFESLYLLGRAQRQFHGTEDDYDHGDNALDEALAIGRTLYGENSEEVGLVYLEVGRPNTHNVEPRVASRRRGIVMSSRFVPGDIRHDALVRAGDIFANLPHREVEMAQVQAIQGLNLMILGRKYAAYDLIESAMRRLTAAGYADDTMVSVYLTWIRMRTTSFAPPRRERALEDVVTYAALRTDGDLHPLSRAVPRYPSGLAQRHVEGRVMLTFDVDEGGQPLNIVVTESDPAGQFDAVSIEAISRFRYVSEMSNGQEVITEGVVYTFNFSLERSQTSPFPLNYPPVLPPIGPGSAY